MKHIFHTIQHTARAAAVLLLALLAAQTAWAQTNVNNAAGLAAAFQNTDVSVINVTDDITGVGNLLPPDHDLTINLNGHTISGDGLHFNVGPTGSLTINGGGSVGNIISSNAELNAIDNDGTVTLRNVNITTNFDFAIFGTGMLYIGNNVSFNGWTVWPFDTPYENIENGNYSGTVVATVTVGGTPHYFENLGVALVYIDNNADKVDFSWSGDTYTIHTATGWGYFCDMLEAGETFSGKTVKLANDITVTRMAGGQPFTGTFDGAGHTLTLAYGTADAPVDAQFVAPFVETASGTSPVFRNLTIDGTIYATHTAATDHDHVGGLIGHLFGDVTIEHCVSRVEIHAKGGAGGFVGLCEHSVSFTDCHSSAVITSADGSNSGFVAWSRDSGWEINFTGCLFDGKLLQQNGSGASNGGFIGWKGDAKTVTITNCLCAPATLAVGETMATDGSATFSREHSEHPATIKNSYYTAAFDIAQGKQAHTVTAGTDVTVAHAGVATHYATSGITAYKATGASADSDPFIAGLLYNNNVVDVLYAGSDEVVSLTLSNTATGAPAGYQYGYTTNAGTLEGSTLTMPDQDVTVSVNTEVLTAIDWATVSTGADKDNAYMIYNKDQLDLLAHRVNGTHGETRREDGYENKFFQLAKDISYPHTSDWNDFDSDESNYEAIGGYYNGERYFRGHFDGNNKTISGIHIYKDGTGNADRYQGIFGRTYGADIHNLTLADARITGFERTGGIVGYNEGGTVSGCHVAADVAVCAVQSVAYYHGGIAGYNDGGDIEQCTSAVTLTTADADNSYCYGGIAGDNYYGTLRDNLAIGATVPATARSSYGAITGDTYGGTLQRNYYAACKVADVENATGVGCGYISDGNGGRIVADVNNDNNPNGAVSIHTLTLADGITTSTTVTVTIGTTDYYAQGTTIALNYSGTPGNIPDGYQYEDGDGFTASAGTLSGSTLTMPAADVTVSLALRSTGKPVEFSYVDAGGTTLTHDAIALDGTETDLNEGWYFVGKDISYTQTLTLTGDVTLILKDGCEMNVGESGSEVDGYGIICYDEANDTYYDLTICGQTAQTGTLSVYTTGQYNYAIGTRHITVNGGNVIAHTDGRACGIATKRSGNVTINRGSVSATTTYTGSLAWAINAAGNLTINGGNVSAKSNSQAIQADGNVAINGGTVNATGGDGDYSGIYSNGTIEINGGNVTASSINSNGTAITLGWTDYTDRITASSISTDGGTVAVADGKALTDGSGNIYTGTLTASVLSGFAAETTLQPCLALADAADNTAAITDHAGQPLAVALSGRTLYKDGSWNTLCLPFALTDEQIAASPLDGADIRALSPTIVHEGAATGFDPLTGTLTLNFTPAAPASGAVNAIEAGVPYIVKWPIPDGMTPEAFAAAYAANPDAYDLKNPVFTGVTVSSTTAGSVTSTDERVQFLGTYGPAAIASGNKACLFLGGANALYWPDADGFEVGAFRAYFQVDLGDGLGVYPAPTEVRSFVLNFFDEQSGEAERDGEAQGITTTDYTDFTDKAGGWYTINGVRLDGVGAGPVPARLRKGLYIHGGKKVVVP